MEQIFMDIICESCKKDLRLFTDKTIEKHIQKFTKPIYEKEIRERIIHLEKDFIKKKDKTIRHI